MDMVNACLVQEVVLNVLLLLIVYHAMMECITMVTCKYVKLVWHLVNLVLRQLIVQNVGKEIIWNQALLLASHAQQIVLIVQMLLHVMHVGPVGWLTLLECV
jgi:hypothetical protein